MAGLALICALALLLPGLGAVPLDDPGEGQHAEIAREVGATGSAATLRLNGVRYFDKPPLLYWLTAASFRVAGPTEWAARLVPAAGAALAVAGTAVLGVRLLGAGAGLAAGGALLGSALFAAFGRYLRPETLFVAAIQWGMTGLLLGRARDGTGAARWQFVGCAALGLAALAKDPLGLFGPLAAVALALALSRQARPLAGWMPWWGLALLGVIGLGWYAAAALANPGFLWYTVVDNHLLNALRLRQFPDEDVPLGTLEFLAVAAFGCFPFALGAALAAGDLIRHRAWRDPEETPWVALAIWTAGVLAAGLLVPFRLPHYALPAYPAMALLAARAWLDRRDRPRGIVAAHLAVFAALALLAAVAAASDGLRFTGLVFSATDVYTRKEAARAEMGALPPWALLRPLVEAAAVVFGATAAALGVALWRGGARLGLAAVLVGMLALTPLVESALAFVAGGRAVAAIAARVRQEMRPGDRLVHEGPIENSGALEFYSGRRPALLDGRRSVLGFGATLPESADTFWDRERFTRAWFSGGRVLLVTPRAPDRSAVAALPAARVRLLLEHNGRRLYDNGPPAR